jgi:hypothetical protein
VPLFRLPDLSKQTDPVQATALYLNRSGHVTRSRSLMGPIWPKTHNLPSFGAGKLFRPPQLNHRPLSFKKKNRRRRPFGLLLVSVISPTHRLLSPTSVGEYLLSCFSSPLTPWMPCTDLRSLDFVFWPASLRNGSKVLGRLTSKVILQFV